MLYYLSQRVLEWSTGTAWADHLSALRKVMYLKSRSADRWSAQAVPFDHSSTRWLK